MARKVRQKWDACVDCGIEKVNAQRFGPRCRKCAQQIAQNKPETREKMSMSLKKKFEDNPELRAKRSENSKLMWSNPEKKEEISRILQEMHSTEEMRKKISERTKEGQSKPGVREKISEAAKRMHSNPEFKKKHAERIREALSKPDVKAKLKARKWSIKRRIALSIRLGGDGDIERIDHNRRISLGIARSRVSEHNKWARAVKERDEHRCQHCGSTEDLHSHHIKSRAGYPELALDIENGITLCRGCHRGEHNRLRSS